MSQLTLDLSAALLSGDAATVARLLEAQCADNLMVSSGVPLLVHACEVAGASPACVEAVLKRAKNVNVTDYRGQTPLMMAVNKGAVKIARRLLAAGARIGHCDGLGRDALHLAALAPQPKPELLRLLMDAGASPAASDFARETALHFAARTGFVPAMRALLERQAPVYAVSRKGRTPLHLAAEGGSADACRLLVQSGASVDPRDEEGWTPLLVAVASWQYAAARVLIFNKADVNARLNEKAGPFAGFTPLAFALAEPDGGLRDERAPRQAFDREFCEALVEAGAELNPRLGDGTTLSERVTGNAEALEFLRQHGMADGA